MGIRGSGWPETPPSPRPGPPLGAREKKWGSGVVSKRERGLLLRAASADPQAEVAFARGEARAGGAGGGPPVGNGGSAPNGPARTRSQAPELPIDFLAPEICNPGTWQ